MRQEFIDIRGLNKADVLAALYNAAEPFGMGFLHYIPGDMTTEEAQEELTNNLGARFDYLKGRCIKTDIDGDFVDPRLFDVQYGAGAAARAIIALKRSVQSPSEDAPPLNQG